MRWLGHSERSVSELSQDATRLAGGSGTVFLGGVVDRGLRWVVKWFLAGVLGPVGLGLYEAAVTVAATLTSFTPLGLDTGVVFFASRYKSSGEAERLKGILQVGLGISLVMGLVSAAIMIAGLLWVPGLELETQTRQAMLWIAPVVAVWTPLLFAVGSLRAMKDMKRSAVAFQLALPATLLASILVWVGLLDWGVRGAILSVGVATAVGLALALRFAWGHYGSLLRDRSIVAVREIRILLAFSIPQSLTAAAFRLNMRMDILMLAALSSMGEVGLYAVAASLAAIGSMPANAIASMFNPVISELVYADQLERLNGLLKIVTRWLIIGATPVYLGLLLLPDLALSIYDPAFAVGVTPLVILVLGQLVNTACAPTMRLIPMSGHSMLNLINGLVALALNIGLNAWLIPLYGAQGAALATGITLAAWSLWRVVEVWFLLRCFPFDYRSLFLLALGASGAAVIHFGMTEASLGSRTWGTAVLIGVFLAAAWTVGRGPEDEVVLGRIRTKIERLLRRR
jgi:O-antigen/teichoic acid export membrane protein